jgi:hypothetical protein
MGGKPRSKPESCGCGHPPESHRTHGEWPREHGCSQCDCERACLDVHSAPKRPLVGAAPGRQPSNTLDVLRRDYMCMACGWLMRVLPFQKPKQCHACGSEKCEEIIYGR